mgnify:CR=1 FL=1
MQNDEKNVKEVAEKVLEIERETRSINNGSNKTVAVNKILKMLDEVTKNDN